ncbi:hypothetical protein ACTS9U_03875 [Empedobacter falsenii]|uniref:hypothetical protein n=1 Tax=unclassified Empedobacter TaxID=2643773 RepID=UPI0025B7ED94|nr:MULTISPECIES: hypothetical protein [unclassified Empedobacter]
MAFIEGTLDEIYKFLGPRTSDIVTQLARPHRKNKYGNRISCGEKNNDSSICKQYTGLHAAHQKGRERKVLIQEILEDFGEKISDTTYKIDLNLFEEEFKNKHENFHKVIKFMCPKHHKNYDSKDNSILLITDEELDELIEFTDTLDQENLSIDIVKDLLKSVNPTDLKKEIGRRFNLNPSQISFSNISKESQKWNFDIDEEKFNDDFIFIFIDKNKESYKLALIKANTLDLSIFPIKGFDKKRFVVEQNYIDKTGFDFNQFIINH